ncbi:MAG: methyltransferase domain-containing protein [Candidatus Omnitrophica bacterium]|nr:methyltransferase domain-containing protein [Candidatus Omnitrophota bacterium]
MQRDLRPERMDQPDLDERAHLEALDGLARLHQIGRSARSIWAPIRAETASSSPLRILDVATGGGDLPIDLWRLTHRAGISVQIDGFDRSPQAIGYAREKARRAGAPIRFFNQDALADPLPGGYDVLFSSLFLHHLETADAQKLLGRMASAAGRMILVHDLIRSRLNAALMELGAAFLTRSPVVHADAPQSVRAAFTLPELAQMAQTAGLPGARLIRTPPFRFLLIWRKPAGHG